MKDLMDKEIVFFGIKFRKFIFIMLIVFVVSVLQGLTNVVIFFFSGPMGWTVFWIFKSSLDITFVSYYIYLNKALIGESK
jgi:hypothetical protein